MSDVEAVIFLGRSQRCTASRTPDPGVGQRVLHEGLYIGVAGSLLAGPVLHEHVPDGLAVEPVDQLGLRGDVPDLLPRHAPSAGARHVARGRPGGTGFSGAPLSAPREYSRCRARQRVADGNPPLMYLDKVKEVQFETHFDRLRKPVKLAGSPLPS